MLKLWNLTTEGERISDADASADGTMPTRAFRYCEAMRLASGTGAYVHAPQDMDLMLDTNGTIFVRQWHEDGTPKEWTPVQPSVWLDGWDDKWNAQAPESLHGTAPPPVTALREAGYVQFVLGIAAKIAEPWRVWVRAPANLPRHPQLDFFEGIMRCDTARIVFINARITQTDVPVPIRQDRPLAQLIPVHSAMFHVPSMLCEAAPPWDEVRGSMQTEPNDKPAGTYAAEERKRIKRGLT